MRSFEINDLILHSRFLREQSKKGSRDGVELWRWKRLFRNFVKVFWVVKQSEYWSWLTLNFSLLRDWRRNSFDFIPESQSQGKETNVDIENGEFGWRKTTTITNMRLKIYSTHFSQRETNVLSWRFKSRVAEARPSNSYGPWKCIMRVQRSKDEGTESEDRWDIVANPCWSYGCQGMFLTWNIPKVPKTFFLKFDNASNLKWIGIMNIDECFWLETF